MSPRAPCLLICGFGPFPAAPDNPSAMTVRRLEGEGWSPAGASACAYAVLPTVWSEAAEAAMEALRRSGAGAVLLVGVAVSAATFRVEVAAHNRASTTRPDAGGACWPHAAIADDGLAARAATAPIQALRAAIAAEGLPVVLSKDAGDYLCNFTFYRMLAEADGVPCAFLHVPQIGEDMSLDDIARAVRAAAQALAAATHRKERP